MNLAKALLVLSILIMAAILVNGFGASVEATGSAASKPAPTQPAQGRDYTIRASKTERFGAAYAVTLDVLHDGHEVLNQKDARVQVIYLKDAKPGEASRLAIEWSGEGSLGVGTAGGDGKGFHGVTFHSFGGNWKEGKGGGFLWISLPDTAPFDLTRQKSLRVPVGDWLVSRLSFSGVGRCALCLGTIDFGKQEKDFPRFVPRSNVVEMELDFTQDSNAASQPSSPQHPASRPGN